MHSRARVGRAAAVASTTPSWRWSRPSSAPVSRATTSSARRARRASRRAPRGRSAGSRTPASRSRRRRGRAHGTTDADGEELRLRRDAPLPGVEVAGGDRVRHRQSSSVSPGSSSCDRRVRRLARGAASGVPGQAAGTCPSGRGCTAGCRAARARRAASRGPIVKWSPIGSTA